MQQLPRPVTGTEAYLAAILDELRVLRALAEKPPANAPTEIVELREPEAPAFVVTATPLPADFPGRQHLEAAGIAILEDVPDDGDALVAIPGIGKVTAGQILARLKGYD